MRLVMTVLRITSPDEPALAALCAALREKTSALEQATSWPDEQLRWCGEAGVFEWFVGPEHGGQGWSEANLLRGYVQLAAACLTTTFVITQRVGAMQRIAAGNSLAARERLLPDLLSGKSFATVGISHLTTSRQHLTRPVLRAGQGRGGFVLDGYSPWVTGAAFAQTIVLGATLEDHRQILVALPTELPGVRIDPAPELVGLSASHTGPVRLDHVEVAEEWLLAGPVHEVMKHGLGARTGGLQTSALALGLASEAIAFLESQADARDELVEPAEALLAERNELQQAMLALAGDSEQAANLECAVSGNELRRRANSLVLRASQAALAAAKGAGYIAGQPAGRWCREALFFLVWCCPAPVAQANLCELAGIAT
jgi:alkylation response protein AidB-like acyl-CoA dehydrogenase